VPASARPRNPGAATTATQPSLALPAMGAGFSFPDPAYSRREQVGKLIDETDAKMNVLLKADRDGIERAWPQRLKLLSYLAALSHESLRLSSRIGGCLLLAVMHPHCRGAAGSAPHSVALVSCAFSYCLFVTRRPLPFPPRPRCAYTLTVCSPFSLPFSGTGERGPARIRSSADASKNAAAKAGRWVRVRQLGLPVSMGRGRGQRAGAGAGEGSQQAAPHCPSTVWCCKLCWWTDTAWLQPGPIPRDCFVSRLGWPTSSALQRRTPVGKLQHPKLRQYHPELRHCHPKLQRSQTHAAPSSSNPVRGQSVDSETSSGEQVIVLTGSHTWQ